MCSFGRIRFAKALLIATCTSVATIGCLVGKLESGDGGRC